MDSEYANTNGWEDGGLPLPHTFSFRNLETDEVLTYLGDDLRSLPGFPLSPEDTFVAYFLPAEVSAMLALGWEPPPKMWDLYPVFRQVTNVEPKEYCGRYGLLQAADFFCGASSPLYGALDTLEFKSDSRDLAMRGEPYSSEEWETLRKYCEADVDTTARIARVVMARPDFNLDLFIHWGRYMTALAYEERVGIPLDEDLARDLKHHAPEIRLHCIRGFEREHCFGIFDDKGRHRRSGLIDFLNRFEIPWESTATGAPRTDEEYLVQLSKEHPVLEPYLRAKALADKFKMLGGLAIGPDGRNRCLMSPFSTKTGRNAPSTKKFLFAMPKGFRRLVKPPSGYGFVQIDWAAEELAIAAFLSGDDDLMTAYLEGDPYIGFAIRAGAAPTGASKKSHPEIRDRYKTVMLAVGYGQTEFGLAETLGIHRVEARELLLKHRAAFPRFWEWTNQVVETAAWKRHMQTRLGWSLYLGSTDLLNGKRIKDRTLVNFPIQGTGGDLLRLASIRAMEAGLDVGAPVHDALLLCAPLGEIEEQAHELEQVMARASMELLDGVALRSETSITVFPDRYESEKGHDLWELTLKMLEEVKSEV
jgi:hypothetical protein